VKDSDLNFSSKRQSYNFKWEILSLHRNDAVYILDFDPIKSAASAIVEYISHADVFCYKSIGYSTLNPEDL